MKSEKIATFNAFVIILAIFFLPQTVFSEKVITSQGIVSKASLVLKSNTQEVRKGDTITIMVVASRVINLYGAAFDIVYDPGVLSYQGCEEGGFLKRLNHKTNFAAALENGEEGSLVVGVSRIGVTRGVSGMGILATVSLKVIGEEQGQTEISLDKITLKKPGLQDIQTGESDSISLTIDK